jgi:two-component system NtrC family sensor kinase
VKLVLAMVAAVALVAGLAAWDDARESDAALEDFAESQALLAQSVASELSSRLEGIHRDAARLGAGAPLADSSDYLSSALRAGDAPGFAAPADGRALPVSVPLADGRRADFLVPVASLFAGAGRLEHANTLAIWFLPPGAASLVSTDGRRARYPALATALEGGATSLRIPRPEPAQLSLSPRTAFAGLARVSGGSLGRWGVAVVASAERVRDRESWARRRLLLSIVLAAGLVLSFGGLAVRTQRKELALAHQLAMAAAARDRDDRLARVSRAATMMTLASGMAHELSTPLGVIVGRAEQLLAKVSDDERAAKSARAILEQTERIQSVMRGFLDLARGGAPALQEVEASQLIAEATSLVEHRFARAQVRLATEVPAGLPALRCDHRLIEHALVNLLLNACDAAPRGSQVQLSVRAEEGGLTFSVLDQGVGIPVDQAARAVEPFFTTKPSGKGTGLGLAVANEIVKSHHGSLSIGPATPHGTCARIQLPLSRGPSGARA